MEAALSARAPLRVWLGRALSALAMLFLAFDALGKLLRAQPVIEGTVQLGYPASAVLPIGVLLAVGVALYALPRTAVLGAVYLSAYLGGAVATHFRVGSPLPTHTLFPVYVACALWGGLVLRDPALLRVLVRPQE